MAQHRETSSGNATSAAYPIPLARLRAGGVTWLTPQARRFACGLGRYELLHPTGIDLAHDGQHGRGIVSRDRGEIEIGAGIGRVGHNAVKLDSPGIGSLPLSDHAARLKQR